MLNNRLADSLDRRCARSSGLRAFLRAQILIGISVFSICGCQSHEDSAEAAAPQAGVSTSDGVELTAEQAEKIGIETQEVQARTYVPEARGFAVVLSHDVIAQSISDVVTADAAERQSRAALTRVRGLANTPGAFSAETLETAEHQARADEAALTLARRKFSAAWGEHSPWGQDERSAMLGQVAAGQLQLVRVTFPFGVINDAALKQLRFSRAGSRADQEHWISTTIWSAPADVNIPGRSLYALLKAPTLSEGERLDAWAEAGEAVKGVSIPRSAVVVHDEQYWCYIAQGAGHYIRRLIDAERPMADGYFSPDQIAPGERVVVKGGSLLLAREMNPSTEAAE
ncbi:MAG: hypothetical protein ACJ8OJ_04490 [Povalibacter sp.]